MLQQNVPLALTFDDVLLVPRASEVLPSDVDVSTTLAGLRLHAPLLSAAMDTVTEARTAIAMASNGGLGVVHKNLPIASQAEDVALVKEAEVVSGGPIPAALDARGRLLVGGAVGTGADGVERVAALVDAGVDMLFVDTAHGHSLGVLRAAAKIKEAYPHIPLVVGNVATPGGARACFEHGADVVKVGVGPGSICTTRIVAGHGVPQLTAVAECAAIAEEFGRQIIADGGVKSSGDLAKAIAAGGHAIMLGSMFAGTDETPGEVVRVGDRRFKNYRGMGSVEAMEQGSSDRYFQDRRQQLSGSQAKKLVPEGVVARVPARGPIGDVVYQLVGGLRSAMGYSGCANLEAMRRDARFVRITAAGLHESHVHDVEMIAESPNYRGR